MRICVYPGGVHKLALLVTVSILAGHVQIMLAADQPSPAIKVEHFDRAPEWEGYNNHNVPKEGRMVNQDFGYSKTQFASRNPGEIGGRIQRASAPASYAAPLTAA